MSEAAAEEGQDEESTYSGLVGAFPYAFRRSDSWLFRSYVLIGGLIAVVVTLLFALALIVLVAETTGGPGGSFTVSRAFFIVIGLFVVGPVLAPILSVARHHRRERADGQYDFLLALAGYLFLFSLYVGVVITVPPAQQVTPTGALAPVIGFLYALPALVGLLPPLLAAAGIYLVHRIAR
jgi:sugar phosphate permease